MKRIIYWTILFVLLWSMQSCAVYEKHELPQYKINTLKDVNYQFFVLYRKGSSNRAWVLENANVKKYEVTGYGRELNSTEIEILMRKRRNYTSRKSQYNVLLSIADAKLMENSQLIHLDYTEVEMAEVYELNQGKSVLSSYLSVFGVPLAAFSLIGIIAVIAVLLGG